eukprot:3201319-Pyramimonas_sp.AAC.1
MRPHGLGLHLICQIGALSAARWWWSPPAAPVAPPRAELRPGPSRWAPSDEGVWEAARVPLGECLAAALEARGPSSTCPDLCTPCPACETGETSVAFQLGLGVLAYLLLEALKAALRLVGGEVQTCRPRWRPEPLAGSPPWLEAPEEPDFAKLAAEQARASPERSRCQAVGCDTDC